MIELLVFDVDGCLTDGSITYDSNGIESKSFNVKDGLAISCWNKMGKKSAIITGRNSTIVQRRAGELGISHLHQGIKNKQAVLDEILEREHLTYDNVAAIGDDLNDYYMLKRVALSFTPSDGSEYIKEIVSHILSEKGGHGAVREMIELIIKKEKIEKEFLDIWL
jgi:3-deoxy-D-manno-octulosonate 8-phosphate phosphatase (KDO 8-P phosphatase)